MYGTLRFPGSREATRAAPVGVSQCALETHRATAMSKRSDDDPCGRASTTPDPRPRAGNAAQQSPAAGGLWLVFPARFGRRPGVEFQPAGGMPLTHARLQVNLPKSAGLARRPRRPLPKLQLFDSPGRCWPSWAMRSPAGCPTGTLERDQPPRCSRCCGCCRSRGRKWSNFRLRAGGDPTAGRHAQRLPRGRAATSRRASEGRPTPAHRQRSGSWPDWERTATDRRALSSMPSASARLCRRSRRRQT